jgi:hypothetical protein
VIAKQPLINERGEIAATFGDKSETGFDRMYHADASITPEPSNASEP